MQETTEQIRQDIEETRADLGERIECLASRAGRAVDVSHQLGVRPWTSVAVAVGIGLFAGYLRGTRDATSVTLTPGGTPSALKTAATVAIGGFFRDVLRRRLNALAG